MKLSNLNKYNEIVIQMHNNPDADAVGSGFALYKYFKSIGKNVRLVYGGNLKITKSNIVLLLDSMNIPAEYVTELDYVPELLLTVDCQYGEGNVQKFDAENIAMIDHHNTGRLSDDMSEIRSHLVSCSTICYDMLRKSGVDINSDIDMATALYYGMFMDSNGFAEIRHPLERDMIDFLKINKSLIKRLCHTNFTLSELETAGIALLRYSYDENKRLTIINSKPCDPNILGVIGDMVLQVDSVDVSIIYNDCQDGYKLSIRSCAVEVAANDFAAFLTKDIGNGGGHNDKAGGYISKKKFREKYGDEGIDTYFFDKVSEFYDSFDVINAKDGIKDHSDFELYEKKNLTYGFVKTTDMFETGTECKVRTYEGDVFVVADDRIYIMIGHEGGAYPIEKEIFERKYTAGDKPYCMEFEYSPSVINLLTNTSEELMPHSKECFSNNSSRIYAKKLTKAAKVFTKWDYETYMLGNIGDYICYPEDDDKDIYIIKGKILDETYNRINM